MSEKLSHIISQTLGIMHPDADDKGRPTYDLEDIIKRFPPPMFIGRAVPGIVSTRLGRFLWVGEGIGELCGYSPEDFTKGLMKDWLPVLHTPEHGLMVGELFMKTVQYLQTELSGRMDIQINIDHTFLWANGERKRVIAHVWPLHWESDGGLSLLGLYFIDISFLGKCGAPSVNILSNGKLLKEFMPDASIVVNLNLLNLTEREMELLMMEAEGLGIDGISERTGLSKATIYTHRRNILQRSGHDSTRKLIEDLRAKGVI